MRTAWLLNSTALRGPDGPGNGAAAPAGDTTSPDPGPSGSGAAEDIAAIFEFDPFTPSEPETTPSGQEGSDKKATESAPSPAGDAKKAGDEQVPPKGATSEGPKPDASAQQLAEIAALLRAQTEKKEPTEPKKDGPKEPKFNLSIPESITKKLLVSEDPAERAQGLVEFANGLSNYLYETVAQEFGAALSALERRVPTIARSQVTEITSQAEMNRDFWDSAAGPTIPEAQRLPMTPQMGQFVALTAQALAKELVAKGQKPMWTPDFRNELVKRVFEGLGRPVPTPGNGQQSMQRQVSSRTPKASSFATGQGNRGSDQTQFKSEVQKDIAELFDA